MGVAGSGKTAVGEKLAETLGLRFVEGDLFHPPRNIALMAAGTPLSDADRVEWLDAIGRETAKSAAAGEPIVIACSALKRAYRDRLRGFCPEIVFVFLEVDVETAKKRVAARRGHFMPASLVESQFSILEPPLPEEGAIPVDSTRPIGSLLGEFDALFR